MLYYGYLLQTGHRLGILNSSIEYTLIQFTRKTVMIENRFRCKKNTKPKLSISFSHNELANNVVYCTV
jgi:hypothetical protein